jgi:chemotaxis methyl-accepting protein methylase
MTTGAADDEAGFLALTEKIARERRFACGSYKDRCLRRRVAVRMRACRVDSYAAYATHLETHPEEWEKLLDALTINVTKFFRNPDVYDALAEDVVPALWALPERTLRVWSAGCSSGEETYSIAMLFHRYAATHGELSRLSRVEVLGTDIDRRSLAAAERASYAGPAFVDTPAEFRQAYFTPGEPAEVSPVVRAITKFEKRDLLNDPVPKGAFHLVVCRNVMIYFDRASQDRLVERFHSVLVPGGFLALGKTETLFGVLRDRFVTLRQRERLYRRP